MSRDCRYFRKILLSSAAALSLGAAAGIHPAYAQDVAGSPAETTELETITVTAQRRSANLQTEALSVSAISGETIQKANIVDIAGLNGYVPGLLAQRSSGSELMINIRGVGSETPQNIYGQPGVSVFIDGLYVPTSLGVLQGFFDLDRVEVLRGPQGTLFGQSSTGGAISIVSKQPVLGDFGGDASFSYGNYNLNREFLGLNIPLSDTLALRASFQHYAHDGFAENVTIPGYDLDEAGETNAKLSLLWKPTDDFSATFMARSYETDTNGAAQKNILDPNTDPREVQQDFPSALNMTYQMYSANLVWELPFMTVKSITGFQKMKNDQQIDNDRLTYDLLGRWDAQAKWASNSETWSQEINLVSIPGGKLDWIAGIFMIESKVDQYIVEFRGDTPPPSSFNIPPPTGPTPADLGYEEYSEITRRSWAPFFQATYHFTDDLRITGGARYNHDSYKGKASFFYSPLASVPDFSEGTTTGKLELEYDVAPDNMIYGSWTRGYKPGGINNAYDGSSIIVEQGFNKETVDSYEIGSKNEFLDRTLRLNLSAFYSVYKDMQYLSSDPVMWQDGTANIPDARIWGLELEGSWLALDNRLRINGNLTSLGGELQDDYFILDAQSASAARAAYIAANPGASEYDAATVAAVAAAAANSKGSKPPKLPKWAGSINAAYTFDAAGGTITPKIEYVYRGDFIYRVFDSSALDQVPSYSSLNLYIDYVPPVEGLRFSLSATNLTDEDGIGGRFTDPYGSGQTSNEYIAPRQVVFTVGYSF